MSMSTLCKCVFFWLLLRNFLAMAWTFTFVTEELISKQQRDLYSAKDSQENQGAK